MTKRGWRRAAVWDLGLVGGPLVIARILALRGWSLGTLRLALLGVYGLELIVIVPSGWLGVLTVRTRGGSYASPTAPAADEVFALPDPTNLQEIQMGSRIRRDPIAIGPGIAAVLLLLSFAILHWPEACGARHKKSFPQRGSYSVARVAW